MDPEDTDIIKEDLEGWRVLLAKEG